MIINNVDLELLSAIQFMIMINKNFNKKLQFYATCSLLQKTKLYKQINLTFCGSIMYRVGMVTDRNREHRIC